MKQQDVERLVRQMTWREPSPALRARVLSAATVAGEIVTWSDRVWYSRGWRLSAAGAVLSLLLFDQFSTSSRSADFAPASQAVAEATVIDETGRQMGLAPEVASAFARRALSEASARTSPDQASTALRTFDVDGLGGGR